MYFIMELLLKDFLKNKLHTRSLSTLSAVSLILGGLIMCAKDMAVDGQINIKTAFVEGTIETGSLGLMVIFIGLIIIIGLNFDSKPYKGQEFELEVDGIKLKGKGLSQHKIKDLVEGAKLLKDRKRIITRR